MNFEISTSISFYMRLSPKLNNQLVSAVSTWPLVWLAVRLITLPSPVRPSRRRQFRLTRGIDRGTRGMTSILNLPAARPRESISDRTPAWAVRDGREGRDGAVRSGAHCAAMTVTSPHSSGGVMSLESHRDITGESP